MNYKRLAFSAIPIFLLLICTLGYSQKVYYVSTLAGDTSNLYKGIDSNAGWHDGAVGTALFNGPSGIALDGSGNVYVTDTYNNVIREINVKTNVVTTIAGDTADIKKGLDSNIGYLNGSAYKAQFNSPWGICVDKSGNVYVADTYNNVIRKIAASSGVVSTYAGRDSSGVTFSGYVNGPDSVAEFFVPTALAIDTAGNIFVSDYGNNAVREIWASTHKVTTIAGLGPDTEGYMNGPIDTAQFSGMFGIALGKAGSVFVSQAYAGVNAIRRIYNDTVITYSGFDTIGFDTLQYFTPSGYANGRDSMYFRGDTILFGTDTVPQYGGYLLYNDPAGIAFDTSGNLLVADEYNNVIRLVNTSKPVSNTFRKVENTVSTLAGNYYNDSITFMNGADSVAVFYNPIGIVADKKGNIYVTDAGNNLIRKIAGQSPVAVQQVKKPVNTMNVYPNPCTNVLYVVSCQSGGQAGFNGKAELLDVTGRVVFTDNNLIPSVPTSGEEKGMGSTFTINTSSITPGVYFLRLIPASQQGGAIEIRKIEVVR